MFYGIEKTRQINRFVDVKIPSARSLYMRYGAQQGTGVFSTGQSDVVEPVNFGSTVIGDVIRADNIISTAYQDSMNHDV